MAKKHINHKNIVYAIIIYTTSEIKRNDIQINNNLLKIHIISRRKSNLNKKKYIFHVVIIRKYWYDINFNVLS